MGVLKDHAGGKYLRADDIDGVGQNNGRVLTILDFTEADVSRESDEQSELKPIIHFKDDGVKPMVLNKTNLNFVLGHYGDEEHKIIGKKVLVWVDDNVQYAGNRVKGLRLAAPRVEDPDADPSDPEKRPDTGPAFADDIPF